MKSTINSMQFNYHRYKSLLRYKKYPSGKLINEIFSFKHKKTKKVNKTHHF